MAQNSVSCLPELRSAVAFPLCPCGPGPIAGVNSARLPAQLRSLLCLLYHPLRSLCSAPFHRPSRTNALLTGISDLDS
jgi:hypothetical protein